MDKQPFLIRYNIVTKLFTDDGKYDFEPVRLQSIVNTVDYSKSFTPMMTATFQFAHTHMNIIRKNENRLLISIKMTRIKYISNSADNSNLNEAVSDIVFDTIFVPIVESSDITAIREYEESPDKSAVQEEDVMVYGNDRTLNLYTVRMYLNTLEYHLMYKKTYNTVLRGANNSTITIDTALRFICESCGAKGYIIDKPDNIFPMENIIIPPGNVKYCFDVLQTMYGVYLKDILSFFDIDSKLYILSRLKKEHDFEKGKPKEVQLIIATTSDTESLVPGLVIYDTNDTIIHTSIKKFEDRNVGIASGEAYGDSIIFTNFGLASDAFKYVDGKLANVNSASEEYLRNTVSHNSTGEGVSFEYDELNNSFNLFSTLESMGITSLYIVKTEGMDIDCLKPNVIFKIKLSSTDKKLDERFIDKKFPVMGYVQQFLRERGSQNDIFKTFETISLANLND